MPEPSFECRLRGFLAALAGRCGSCFGRGGARCTECFSHGARLLADEFRLYRVVDAYARAEEERTPGLDGAEAIIMGQLRLGRVVRGDKVYLPHAVDKLEKRRALQSLVAKGLLSVEKREIAGRKFSFYSIKKEGVK